MSLRLYVSDHPEARKLKAYLAFCEMILTGRPPAPAPRPRAPRARPRLRLVLPRSGKAPPPCVPVECGGG